jgi:hypothetical protein
MEAETVGSVTVRPLVIPIGATGDPTIPAAGADKGCKLGDKAAAVANRVGGGGWRDTMTVCTMRSGRMDRESDVGEIDGPIQVFGQSTGETGVSVEGASMIGDDPRDVETGRNAEVHEIVGRDSCGEFGAELASTASVLGAASDAAAPNDGVANWYACHGLRVVDQ